MRTPRLVGHRMVWTFPTAMQATAPRLIDQLDGMLRQKIDKVLVDKDRMIIGAVIGQGS